MKRPNRGARSKWQVILRSSVACLVLLSGCGGATSSANQNTAHTQQEEGVARQIPTYTLDDGPMPAELEVTDKGKITTSRGVIIVGLYGKNAPNTVKNFLKYIDSGFYKDKIFHRVIEGFMIQGGGFDSGLQRAETESPISLEIIPGLKHQIGTLSMARTSDPHSATSQFFICVGVAPQLNGAYAAFGKVEQGEEVVKDISRVSTETLDTVMGPMSDVPVDPVVIESITRLGF